MDGLQKYPVLASGIEVHLNPRGGMLFTAYGLSSLSREQAEFLVACDGTRRFEELLPILCRQDYGDARSLLFTAQMMEADYLGLADEPSHHPARVTGSTTAYVPPHLGIELTAGCNLRCRHCYRESDSSQNQHMPTGEMLGILQRLYEAGLRSVELTGGEPSMHPGFREILAFCGERFQMVAVLTNGTILDTNTIDLYKTLGDKLMLSVSLDSSTAEAHDFRRGFPNSFERTTLNITRLAGAGVKVRVAMTVDEDSYGDIEKTLLLARSLGATVFSYAPVLPLGRGKDWAVPKWALDPQEVMRFELGLAEKYKGFLSGLSEEIAYRLETDENCGSGWRTYGLDPWGKVRPCPLWGPNDLIIGDLTQQTVEEVFSHPVTRAFVDIALPTKEICGDCRLSDFCRYCTLRGFYGSQIVEECRWIRRPEVQEVYQYWRPASDQKH